jgi:hypothetical protein
MKKLFLIMSMLIMACYVHSQTSTEWQPVLINYDGTNENEGIIGHYKLSRCNNEDVVIFKLNNTSAHKFKAQWYHLIQDNTGKDFKGKADLQSLVIEPNKTYEGACKSGNGELVISLKEFGISKTSFGTYIALAFNLQIIE